MPHSDRRTGALSAPSTRRLAVLVVTLATSFALLAVGLSHPAGADTAPGVTANVAPLGVGLPQSFLLSGPQASYQLLLPAEPNLSWSGLEVTIEWPLAATSGTLDVSDTTGRVATLTSPSDMSQPQVWIIPARAQPDQPYLLTFNSTLTYGDNGLRCGTVDTDVATRIIPSLLQYKLTGGHQTVGSYLSGPIATLDVRVPATPDHALSEAALRIESAVVANDVDRNVAVNLVTDGTSNDVSSPLTRVISIDDTGTPGLAVSSDPSQGLVISGSAATLGNQVALLTSRLAPLLQSQTVSTPNAPGVTQVRGNTLTLAQLGQGSLTAAGVSQFSVPLAFDQAVTGHEVSGLSFNFHGTNQAPSSSTSATATLFNGTVPVGTTTLGSGGNWQLHGTLNPTTITRTLNLSLQVSYFGGVGSCNALLPLAVSVDPNSTVTVTPGVTEDPTGFDEMPQMLIPSAQVVLSNPSLSQLQLASQLVCGLQRMTSVPLTLTLSDGAALPASSVPAIVVASSSSSLARAIRPTAVANGSAYFTTERAAQPISVDPDEALLTAGHLASGQPIVALLTNDAAPSEAPALMAALGSQSLNWFNLAGDTAALGPNGTVADAEVASVNSSTVSGAVRAWFTLPWVWVAGGLLVLLVLGGLVLSGWRRRSLVVTDATGPDEGA